MKEYLGHLWETVKDWHPVVIRQSEDPWDNIVRRPYWLSEHCPNGPDDYDAWCHYEDRLTYSRHRTVYFFRDVEVATMFALRWS
jgi:hypothetical protein